MKFEIVSKELKDIAESLSSNSVNINTLAHQYGFPPEVLKKFKKVIDVLERIESRFPNSWNFEELKSQNNKYSIRLNDKYRLICEWDKDKQGIKILNLLEITNHYDKKY
ncbi:MAG: type II toxin-antitoxin system RelE/ParE family toxin [Bacteroidales bacterium]|nr:type II toxin-antitoxin system RelE/ParE family toxin [Bacteroidales bacterium]